MWLGGYLPEIVCQDEDVAAVNKPQGWLCIRVLVIPGLCSSLMYHIKDLSASMGFPDPGIVHCIDKDTARPLMVAKNDEASSTCSRTQDKKPS